MAQCDKLACLNSKPEYSKKKRRGGGIQLNTYPYTKLVQRLKKLPKGTSSLTYFTAFNSTNS